MQDIEFLVGIKVFHPVYGTGIITSITHYPLSKNPIIVMFESGISTDFNLLGKLSEGDPKTLRVADVQRTKSTAVLDCILYVIFTLLGILTGAFLFN